MILPLAVLVILKVITNYKLHTKTELTSEEKESWEYSKKDYIIRKP